MSGVYITIRFNGASQRMDEAKRYGVFAVSEQALKDCNYYCKQDTSALINSSLIHSETDKGILRWITPYAERQYNLPATRRDKNPNAGPFWCQTAQSNHSAQWRRVLDAAVRGRLR